MNILSEAEELAKSLKTDVSNVVVEVINTPSAPHEAITTAVPTGVQSGFTVTNITGLSPELAAQTHASPVNDVKETINGFMDKIALAQANGEQFVETTPEVFEHYMRGQKTTYFIFQNIRVYKHGTREDIEAGEAKTV